MIGRALDLASSWADYLVGIIDDIDPVSPLWDSVEALGRLLGLA